MYYMKAAVLDFEENERLGRAIERQERSELAWDYAPHNLKVTPISRIKQLVSFEIKQQSHQDQPHFEDRFFLSPSKTERGTISKVTCISANILLIESNLSEQHLLQEVILGFLPF